MNDEPIDILLIEDNPADVRLVEEAFASTDTGTTIRTVTTGAEAVDLLTGDEEATLPDLVLLDLDLPGVRGVEVLEAIGDDPELRRLPVIVLTGSDDREDVATCYGSHANAYLTKPNDHAEFVSMAEAVERFWFEHVRLPSP